MSARRYGVSHVHGDPNGDGTYRDEWQICDHESDDFPPPVVFRYPFNRDTDFELELPPKPVRDEFERLEARPEFLPYIPDSATPITLPNIVEMIADDEGGFDQPCKWGNRVGDHAVYCHNPFWLYAPRKCRRTWYTAGEERDEDCRGFNPNPGKKNA